MTGTTTPDSSRIAEDVIGAQRLVSYVVEDADGGNRTYPLGEDAHGVIIYAPSGHMSVQIGSTGRPQYQDGSLHGGTDAERAATAAGYLAYAGRYTVSGRGRHRPPARCVALSELGAHRRSPPSHHRQQPTHA